MNYTIPAALFFLLIAVSSTIADAADSAQALGSHARSACTTSESWTFTGNVFESKREDFINTLKGNIAPVRGFSEALALRRFAPNVETKWLGEYWISRALFDAKLSHIAFGGFANIAARPVQAATAGIQLAAIDCMLVIQAHTPAIELPAGMIERLSSLAPLAAQTPQLKEVIHRAASAAHRAMLAKPYKKPDPRAEEMMALLKGGAQYENLAQGLQASHLNKHSDAVQALDRFFNTPNLPAPLKRYVNSAHILMARNLYSLKQFDRAALHLKQITKSSNELAAALEELAWSQLMDDRLADAIGTAMTLQAGGLRHTFAPESTMVMAMALNELCQYPESVRAIHMFRKNYEKSYEWLQKSAPESYYKLATQYVRKTPGFAVPDRVASEWVRSPLFISSQEELNLLFDERESTTALGKSGSKEQTKLADTVVLKARGIPKRLKAAKAVLKEGDHLPARLIADMLVLKDLILHYRRLQQGAPVWHTILSNYRKTAKANETKLLATVNADLKVRSLRMLSQLEEIAENIQLIEVEIYNGASQDIIWKNAHPDYQKVAQSLKEDNRREQAAKTWDWGRTPANMDEDGAEVWEDELGSFSANLYDNCESKDKYLALKMGR